MASTATGSQLTRAQRSDQARIRNQAVAEFLNLWPLLNPRDIDTTSQSWTALAIELVRRYRALSAQRAGQYYTALRLAETTELAPPVISLATAPVQAISTSLLVTGPIGLKARIGKGMPIEKASKLALVQASGAVARHVADGGRQTLIGTAEADALAVGYARITDGNPCPFCAMLASRGFVYRSRESANFAHNGVDRYHDHCGCTVEPAFSRGQALPAANERYEKLWIESTRGKSGKDAINAFRDALAAQQ